MAEIKLKPCPFCGEKEAAEIFDQNELPRFGTGGLTIWNRRTDYEMPV